MTKLFISVPIDCILASYLYRVPFLFRVTHENTYTVRFSYGGSIPPLDKIHDLLHVFEPNNYSINKVMSTYYLWVF